jgi:hypothetical protein
MDGINPGSGVLAVRFWLAFRCATSTGSYQRWLLENGDIDYRRSRVQGGCVLP